MAALDGALERHGHVVAQVVEAELGVRPVGDVAGVGNPPLGERHQVLDEADGSSQQLVDRLRPLRVALGQVVVDGHEMDASPCEAVEKQGLHGDERLSLTRLHLGDVAFVESDSPHQLDVEEPDADRALEGLPDGGVRLEDQILERLPVLQALLELDCLSGELLVRERLELGLERADVGGLVLETLEAPPLAHAQDALESTTDALRGIADKGTG